MIQEIVLSLSHQVFMPKDYILTSGEVVEHLFAIHKGICGEVKAISGKISKKYVEGDCFGEGALVRSFKMNSLIRAETYVEIYTLSREDFSDTAQKYPEDRDIVLGIIRQKHPDIDSNAAARSTSSKHIGSAELMRILYRIEAKLDEQSSS